MATKQIGNTRPTSSTDPSLDLYAGNKFILGIGIDAYTDFQRLNNAVRDVEDVIKALKTRYQFENATVNLLTNGMATREHILNQLENYESLGPDDVLIVYYSGHGHLKQGRHGFWIPYDAKKNVTATYISTSDVLTRLRAINAKHILLISDSCFSGAFLTEDAIKRSTAGDMALSDLAALPSRWGICSGRQDEYVYDGEPGKNSPFAESIIRVLTDNRQARINLAWLSNEVMKFTRDKSKHLPEGKPLLDVGDKGGQLVLQLRDDVKRWYDLEKEPNKTSKDYSDFLEKYKTSVYIPNALEAKRTHYDMEAWQYAEKMNTVSAYDNYINSDHSPKAYEQEARNQKRNLATSDQQAWDKAIRNIKLSLQEYIKRSDEGKYLELAKKWIDALEDGSVPMPVPKSAPDGEAANAAPAGSSKPANVAPQAKDAAAVSAGQQGKKRWPWAIGGALALVIAIWAASTWGRKSEDTITDTTTEMPSSSFSALANQSTVPATPPNSTVQADTASKSVQDTKATVEPGAKETTKTAKPASKPEPVRYELVLKAQPKSSKDYSCKITAEGDNYVITIKNIALKQLQVFTFGKVETFSMEKGKERSIRFPKIVSETDEVVRMTLSELKGNKPAVSLDEIIFTKQKIGN